MFAEVAGENVCLVLAEKMHLTLQFLKRLFCNHQFPSTSQRVAPLQSEQKLQRRITPRARYLFLETVTEPSMNFEWTLLFCQSSVW